MNPIECRGKVGSDLVVLAQLKNKAGALPTSGAVTAKELRQDFPPFGDDSADPKMTIIIGAIAGTIASPDDRWPAHLHDGEGYNATITFDGTFFTAIGKYRAQCTFDSLVYVFEITISD